MPDPIDPRILAGLRIKEYFPIAKAFEALNKTSYELWPDVDYLMMAKSVRAGIITRVEMNDGYLDLTSLAAALYMERTRCSRMISTWETKGYIERVKIKNSNYVKGTGKYHVKGKIYLDRMAELFA